MYCELFYCVLQVCIILFTVCVCRRETRELGMTVVVDARKIPPPPYFFKALTMLQVLYQGHKPPFISTIDAVQGEIV